MNKEQKITQKNQALQTASTNIKAYMKLISILQQQVILVMCQKKFSYI